MGNRRKCERDLFKNLHLWFYFLLVCVHWCAVIAIFYVGNLRSVCDFDESVLVCACYMS